MRILFLNFDNGPAKDWLRIGGVCHGQGGSHDPSGLLQVQYRRGGFATCESGLRQRGGNSRFSLGIGVTRLLD